MGVSKARAICYVIRIIIPDRKPRSNSLLYAEEVVTWIRTGNGSTENRHIRSNVAVSQILIARCIAPRAAIISRISPCSVHSCFVRDSRIHKAGAEGEREQSVRSGDPYYRCAVGLSVFLVCKQYPVNLTVPYTCRNTRAAHCTSHKKCFHRKRSGCRSRRIRRTHGISGRDAADVCTCLGCLRYVEITKTSRCTGEVRVRKVSNKHHDLILLRLLF